MNAFDQAVDTPSDKCSFLSSSKQTASDMNEEEKVLNYTIFSQGTCLNHLFHSYTL